MGTSQLATPLRCISPASLHSGRLTETLFRRLEILRGAEPQVIAEMEDDVLFANTLIHIAPVQRGGGKGFLACKPRVQWSSKSGAQGGRDAIRHILQGAALIKVTCILRTLVLQRSEYDIGTQECSHRSDAVHHTSLQPQRRDLFVGPRAFLLHTSKRHNSSPVHTFTYFHLKSLNMYNAATKEVLNRRKGKIMRSIRVKASVASQPVNAEWSNFQRIFSRAFATKGLCWRVHHH